MGGGMKALSVRQPWAGLIAAGIKNVENRTWRPPRGKLLICAGIAKVNTDDVRLAREMCKALGTAYPSDLCVRTGAALATVEVVGTMEKEDGDKIQYDFPDVYLVDGVVDATWYNPGCIGWLLANARLVRPFPVKGKLGIFEVKLSPV
jgi:hypothetical protein